MNIEEIYKFNNILVFYDKGTYNDRSCLMIGKADKTNIYLLGELYDESADALSAIINNLQQENKELEEKLETLNKYIKTHNELNKEDIKYILGGSYE